jgi:hypothetical protein
MKVLISTAVAFIILTLAGCQKSVEFEGELSGREPLLSNELRSDKNILVDASKDGGVWWFPQSPLTGFSEIAEHQGQVLADYLRSLGFHVDELGRGAVITDHLLEKYSRIIRAAAFFDYSNDEIEAYKNFLKRPGAILLLQDHLSYSTNDQLSELLGVKFKGAVNGSIANFTAHEITAGIGDLPFIAGAVVTNAENNPNIVVLGSLNGYTVLNNSDPFNSSNDNSAPVMGLVNNFPNTRIFFLGDENGIEMVPQPLTQNLVNWLFN